MTATPRPNLGGLFNGSTPPEQSSSISGAIGPRFLKQLPTDGQSREVPREPARSNGNAAPDAATSATETESPAGQGDRWNVLSWVDPTKIVVQYFAFLQVLLDTNRDLAVSLTSAVMSLPKRGRSH
jgi:hypothetical protein